MFVHFGQEDYGKVDVVPGLCHVATRFFTVNFFPLVPVGSYIVVAGKGKGGAPARHKTALSLKSVLIAWLRAALFLASLGCTLVGFWLTIDFFERRGVSEAAVVEVWAAALSAAVTLWLTYRLGRASYDRALQIGAELGLEAATVEQYFTRPVEKVGEPAREPEGWERYS